MSLLKYDLYYRRYGIRFPAKLVSPLLHEVDALDLPQNSVLHYLPESELEDGPPVDYPLIQRADRYCLVEHITQLSQTEGNPKLTGLPLNGRIVKYHRLNRKMRRVMDDRSAFGDPRILTVISYCLIPSQYRYVRSYLSNYYRWRNLQATMWNQVKVVGGQTDREQYIVCRLPELLPSLSQLLRAESKETPSRMLLTAFDSPEALELLELWKWLSEDYREASLLSLAGEEALSRTNLIFVESGYWTVINLGLLDSWRKTATNKDGVEPAKLQKRFLRLLMFLVEMRNGGGGESSAGTPSKAEVASAEPQSTETPAEDAAAAKTQPKTATTKPAEIPVKTEDGQETTLPLKAQTKITSEDTEVPVVEDAKTAERIDAQISKDLEALERMEVEPPGEEGGDTELVEDDAPVQMTRALRYESSAVSLETAFMQKVDQLAESGGLTGAEYRRMAAIAKVHATLPSPYGEGTLLQASEVKPAQLQLEHDGELANAKTLVDKSMARSRVKPFTERYVKDVLHRDVLGMVNNLHRAGLAVTAYKVDRVEDAVSKYDVHSVQLTPIRGKVSTVTFRLPVVEADGTFKSGGVRYVSRIQRVDNVVRKLAPDRVALTSYYGKVFVSRSEKQVHNYAGWLCDRIAAMGMDPQNTVVTNLSLSNVFDARTQVPRDYSILAHRFRGFEAADIRFNFDYHAREVLYGKDRLKLESKLKRGVIVGSRMSDGALVLMDEGNNLFVQNAGDLEPIASIRELLAIEGKAPREMAEIKVFGKNLPLGFVMAYYLGLTKFIEVLGARHRVVDTGERLELADGELPIAFQDRTYIFEADDPKVSLLLAGLANYRETLRSFPARLFEAGDVYVSVLERNGIGMRYARELDVMRDLFIDPISLGILERLNQPTEFVGLLVYATELLETDWAPDETDLSQMRLRGYERFAGHVYEELVKAVRLKNARGSISTAKIELKPYAVWTAINNDSAVKLVEQTNPVHSLKEKEEITYSGTGGRSTRSMVERTRVFHPSDEGVISEATKDSSDVAVTTFLTADPLITDLRGLTKRAKQGETGNASFLSTSALLAPCADRDDMKRVVGNHRPLQVAMPACKPL